MKIKILTLFPEMIAPMLEQSILGRAIRAGYLDIEIINIRDYAENKHKNTDDYPFGGGAGMVMLPQPIIDAVRANSNGATRKIYMSPRGRTLTQRVVEEYAACDSLLFLCGHYEGVDQRALDACIDEELSIGDYVLTGGELGALVTIDAVARLIPGVLGSEESSEDESFSTGLLEYPQYTRPAEYEGMRVPDVLLGGNHADICAWRREEALKITRARRPELLTTAPLTESDYASLRRMDFADDAIHALNALGADARRADLFFERGYAKAWFDAVVPQEKRSAAKKACFSGRRHVGYLHRAFSEGHARVARDAVPRGSGVLYFDAEGIAIRVLCAEAVPPDFIAAHPCALLTSDDFSACIASQKRAGMPLFFYKKTEEVPDHASDL